MVFFTLTHVFGVFSYHVCVFMPERHGPEGSQLVKAFNCKSYKKILRLFLKLEKEKIDNACGNTS